MTNMPQRAKSRRMLATQTRGQGPNAVLLLHGFLGSGRNLGALARTWSQRDPDLGLVQADLLGHGRSPALPAGADLYALAEAALQLVQTQKRPGPLWVVGHSIGARVGLAMLDLDPSAIAQLTLLDIAPGPTHGLPSTRVAQILLEAPETAPTREAFLDFFEGRGLSKGLTQWLLMNLDTYEAGYRWRIDRQALVAFHLRSGHTDLWPVAQRHAHALSCIQGGDSDYMGPADLERYAAAGIPVVTVPNAGHFLHVDAAEAVVDALMNTGHPADH